MGSTKQIFFWSNCRELDFYRVPFGTQGIFSQLSKFKEQCFLLNMSFNINKIKNKRKKIGLKPVRHTIRAITLLIIV